MFNAGKGRLYSAAYGEDDILNLAGKDVRVYGAFQEEKGLGGGKEYNAWEHLPGEAAVKKYDLGDAVEKYMKTKDAVIAHSLF